MISLPQAVSIRFQPLRSGLLNLFKYQEQEFWYEKGRLLVRGNNGTGKSRVLALQLPFLFDGEIGAKRVEPDGDSARQMAWHLLMDDQFENRTGYTWIEFGRCDADGTEHYVTLGCGMRAVKGGDNQPTRWYFITSQRIGADLTLLDGQTPRSADRLAEALGDGSFFTKTARDYRAEVNRRLFGLSQSAYAALIELLIRLRAPQLSKKLEEKALFEALTNALPPLAPEVVDQVATAFKQLDELRLQYRMLSDLSTALTQFRNHYQVYAQTALMRRSEAATSAHSRYESAQKNLNKLQQTIEAGEAEKAEAEVIMIEVENHLTGCLAVLETLASRPEATQAEDLDAAEKSARERQSQFDQARRRALDAERHFAESSADHDRQAHVVETAASERHHLQLAATAEADPAGFAIDHAESLPKAETWPLEGKALFQIRKQHERRAADHLYRLDQIEAEQTKVAESSGRLKTAQTLETQAFEAMERTRDDAAQHHTAAVEALAALKTAYLVWRAGLKWLIVPAWSELSAGLEDWLETDASEHRQLATAVAMALQREITLQAQAEATLQTRVNELQRQIEALEAESAELERSPASPILPKIRSAAAESRRNRPGAPLWQLCEFQPHLASAECAGLEAALEASGLLDAWISPDGRVSLAQMTADTFLALDEAGNHPAQRSLASLLMADSARADRSVSADVLQRVLGQIGLGAGSGPHWVNTDGSWRLGPLTGYGEKQDAEFVGTRSREDARRRRLGQIAAEKAMLEDRHVELEREGGELAIRKTEAEAEAGKAPKDEAIASHLTLRTHARSRLHAFTREYDDAVQSAARLRQAHAERERELLQLVDQLGYSAHRERLDALRPAWASYERTMLQLWNKAEAVIQAAGHLQRAEARMQQANESHERESQLARDAEMAAIEASQAFQTLRSTVGLSVSDYQEKVSQARLAKAAAAAAVSAARDRCHEVEKKLIGVQSLVSSAEERIAEADKDRDAAIRDLRISFDAGLFTEADDSLGDVESASWSDTRAVGIARQIAKIFPALEHGDDLWTQRLNSLDGRINELRTSVGADCQIEREELPGSLILLNCKFQNTSLRPAGCLMAVEREREQQDRLLNEEERKIIDRHLVTEVSLQLQQLMADAQIRRDRINREMEKCSTTLGVKMKLVWEPIAEGIHPALSHVRSLLLMDHALWSEEQRRTVGSFLQQLITDERTRNPAAAAADQLLHALDYRRWHAFAAERFQNGRWERLTRKRYGTGSGGEKALMLTIPQMAAASSHYSSAVPHAPRFILLDEAFAGMDKPTRSSCMGLLEAFDLDLLMTSEREQGAHATLSGIAIYHLVADTEAVAATRWVWNGSQSRLAPVPDSPELRESFTLQA